MLKLYNTLTRQKEIFQPLRPPQVTLYTCGPTVYDYTHIGHLRKYTGDDLLKRVLRLNNYQVKHVMNITDVGHLTSDADQGEDKLEKGAREQQKSVWEVAKIFTDYFLDSIKQLNIEDPDILAKATDHIQDQIILIKRLEEKGFVYRTKQALYFDVSKFPDYTRLSHQPLSERAVAVREEVVVDPEKKHPYDFALWFFTVGHFRDHIMRWESPWGIGFPGWHIECSAMSMKYLGETIDIHTGGVDHIPIHHTNEIAQSEAATGKQFVRFWVHHEFLLVEGQKMSKSLKNFYTIDDIKKRGFDPLALRYLFLTSHYRDQLNFTWEALQAASNSLNRLRAEIRDWAPPQIGCAEFEKKFAEAMNDDLNSAQALAVMWDMVKSDYPTSAKAASLLMMDKVLGLNLQAYLGQKIQIPSRVKKLLEERELARRNKDFRLADKIREEIQSLGFIVEDTPSGPRVKLYKS